MKTRNQEVLLNKFINLNEESIDLNCPICKEILNQPVTLPCSHNFCKNCLETSIKILYQQCPCCRKRFSYWYRQALKNNQLLNEKLWTKIRENYGDLLVNQNKINENTQRFPLSEFSSQNGVLSDRFMNVLDPLYYNTLLQKLNQNRPQLSQTGEIRKEYLELLEQFKKEVEQEHVVEEKATKNLIVQLYREEFKSPKAPLSKKHKENSNMLVAGPSHAYQSCIGSRTQATAGTSLISGRGNINKSSTSVITISSTSSPSCSSSMSNNYSLLKSVAAVVTRGTEIIKQKVSQRIFTKKDVDQNFSGSPSLLYPTKTHKLSASRRSESVESNDSLKSEVRDFKPIRTAPTTPKKLSGEILRIPSVRPESVGSIVDCPFSPNFSSLSPINRNLPGRRSAFSVVSNSAAITSTPKVVPTKPIPAKASAPKRGNGRKRKSSSSTTSSQNTPEKTVVTVIHLPTNKKVKPNPIEPVAGPSNERPTKRANGRITRSTSLNKLNGLDSIHLDDKEQIMLKQAIFEQEKLEKMLEQERKDFEFAKKLQKKLNKAEQEQNRSEYGLRKTRGKTKVNGLIVETKVVNKNTNEEIDTNVNKGKRKSTKKEINTSKAEKSPNTSVLRRSTRKRR